MSRTASGWWTVLGPGFLVAATGVGAGDLVTASLAGSEVGLVVVWAAVVGAGLKWTLNEGIARWQMATGTTLVDGWSRCFGGWFSWVFVAYFLVWTFAVGGALVNACGIAATAILPIGTPATSKIVWGILHSLVGGALVWRGGFRGFERVMAVSIGLMVVSVLLTAALIVADAPAAVIRGLLSPARPLTADDWTWILGVLGGVGGTVTMLSYGYWIRETGRRGQAGLITSRVDLAVSYGVTALFGVSMVIIGSQLGSTGQGARVAVQLADQLDSAIGSQAKWLFLAGFWSAVFSSLLGVWQSAPYIFADVLRLHRGAGGRWETAELRRSAGYRWYLIGITVVPLVLLWTTVRQVQLVYATLGAWFMPIVALTLLVMNNRAGWVEAPFRNGWMINALLGLTLLLFAYLAMVGIS